MYAFNLLNHVHQIIIEDTDNRRTLFQSYGFLISENKYGYVERSLTRHAYKYSPSLAKHLKAFIEYTNYHKVVNQLIEDKIFKNFKDFMLSYLEIKVFYDSDFRITYKDINGEEHVYKDKIR